MILNFIVGDSISDVLRLLLIDGLTKWILNPDMSRQSLPFPFFPLNWQLESLSILSYSKYHWHSFPTSLSHPLFSRRHSLFSLCLISFHLLTSSTVYMLCICPSFFHLFPFLHFLSFSILLSSIIILFSHLFVFKIRKSPIWGKLRFMPILNFIWIYDMKILLKYFF